MTEVIASAVDLPLLPQAAGARGLQLQLVRRECWQAALNDRNAGAALLGWRAGDGDPAHAVAEARALGWTAPLLLVLPGRCPGVAARALDAGADDVIALPADADEVAARLAARIRPRPASAILLGELRIDRVDRSATRAGRVLTLLPREFQLLLHLARHAGTCQSRQTLLQAVWGLNFDPGTNVVEVHVSRLRAKLDRGFATPMLHTRKGYGYVLARA